MSYSTLMVLLDLDGSNHARLRIAAELAARFQSRVIGVTAGDIQPIYFLDGEAAQSLLDKDRAALKAAMAECEQQFRDTFRSSTDRIEWRSAAEWPARFVTREARAADLIVAGSGAGGVDPLRQVAAGELVLQAGRPVLTVPAGIDWLKFKSVVVAWKDAREARRAVADALPLLHQAEHVLVAELLETGADLAAAKARVEDVAAWLARRGIAAASIATKASIGAADELVIMAQDEGANVIVAGGYGRTRFQEWVFGGVTRTLLNQEKCCALLSH